MIFNFKDLQQTANELPTEKEKVAFWIEKKAEYLNSQPAWRPNNPNITENTFDKKCDVEIEKYEKLLALKHKSDVPFKSELTNITNSQIVLISYYILFVLKIELRVDVDISTIARIIHLVTGKEFSTLPNSDFYHKLTTAPNFKGDKEILKDLTAIKPLFKKVQLNEVVKMIENEIDRCNYELNLKKKN